MLLVSPKRRVLEDGKHEGDPAFLRKAQRPRAVHRLATDAEVAAPSPGRRGSHVRRDLPKNDLWRKAKQHDSV
eukprot:scaffold1311_cov256-Pinguiococcus_pyrenoidosus.AAC.62